MLQAPNFQRPLQGDLLQLQLPSVCETAGEASCSWGPAGRHCRPAEICSVGLPAACPSSCLQTGRRLAGTAAVCCCSLHSAAAASTPPDSRRQGATRRVETLRLFDCIQEARGHEATGSVNRTVTSRSSEPQLFSAPPPQSSHYLSKRA